MPPASTGTAEDVAAALAEAHRCADGTLKEPGGRHRHTYVVTESEGGWTIVAGQNTTVEAEA